MTWVVLLVAGLLETVWALTSPELHQLVTGTDDAVVDYSEILGQGIQLIVDSVARIDAPRRAIELASGAELTYDYLIYAIGSHGAREAVDSTLGSKAP